MKIKFFFKWNTFLRCSNFPKYLNFVNKNQQYILSVLQRRLITCKMYLLPMLIRIHQIRLFNNIGRIRFINVLLLSMYYCCTRRCHCTRLVVLVVWHSMSSQRLKALYTSLQKSMALTFIFPAMPLFLSSQCLSHLLRIHIQFISWTVLFILRHK